MLLLYFTIIFHLSLLLAFENDKFHIKLCNKEEYMTEFEKNGETEIAMGIKKDAIEFKTKLSSSGSIIELLGGFDDEALDIDGESSILFSRNLSGKPTQIFTFKARKGQEDYSIMNNGKCLAATEEKTIVLRACNENDENQCFHFECMNGEKSKVVDPAQEKGPGKGKSAGGPGKDSKGATEDTRDLKDNKNNTTPKDTQNGNSDCKTDSPEEANKTIGIEMTKTNENGDTKSIKVNLPVDQSQGIAPENGTAKGNPTSENPNTASGPPVGQCKKANDDPEKNSGKQGSDQDTAKSPNNGTDSRDVCIEDESKDDDSDEDADSTEVHDELLKARKAYEKKNKNADQIGKEIEDFVKKQAEKEKRGDADDEEQNDCDSTDDDDSTIVEFVIDKPPQWPTGNKHQIRLNNNHLTCDLSIDTNNNENEPYTPKDRLFNPDLLCNGEESDDDSEIAYIPECDDCN